MNRYQIFDVAGIVIFGILAVIELIAVILGYTWNWVMLAVSVVVVAICAIDYCSEKKNQL